MQVITEAASPGTLIKKLEQQKILVLPGSRLRLVTHLDVDAAGIERALDGFRSVAKSA